MTNVAETIRAASKSFIPEGQHERAKAAREEWVEKHHSKDTDETESTEGAAAVEDEASAKKKKKKKRKDLPQPTTPADYDPSASDWDRSVHAYKWMSSGEAPGIEAAIWQGELLPPQEIQEAADAAYEAAPAFIHEIHKMRAEGRRADLGAPEIWMSLIQQYLDGKLSTDELEDALAACVYLRVHIKIQERIIELYIGRSGCGGMREFEHIGTILFHPDSQQWQYLMARGADIVFTMKIFEDKSLERHSLHAWRQRAVIEGVYTIYFHTYRKSDAFNRILASFDLALAVTRGANGELDDVHTRARSGLR